MKQESNAFDLKIGSFRWTITTLMLNILLSKPITQILLIALNSNVILQNSCLI